MKVYDLHDDMIEVFFASARERYRIMLQKRAGQSASTDDPALGRWHFCNVFREDDITTRWIRENVRDPLRNEPCVAVSLMICRLFNRIETLEPLMSAGMLHGDWHAETALAAIKGLKPVMSGAYRVRTPTGMDKAAGLVKAVQDNRGPLFGLATRIIPGQDTLETVWGAMSFLPVLARVVSYEIVSDLRHTYMLDQASDIDTWAAPTAGVASGMSWLVAREPDFFNKELGKKAMSGILKSMLRISSLTRYGGLWPKAWPAWEMRDVAHWLTQFGPYCSATYRGKMLHRRYPVGIRRT